MSSLFKNNLIFLVLLSASFGIGFLFAQTEVEPYPICGVSNQELGEPEEVDFSLFWDSWRILEKKFTDSEKLDYQEMIYGAISGMVKSLEDPYTVFFDPEQSKIFNEDIEGVFEGVGMEIGLRENQLTVIAPLEGTPAQRAGLRPGDKILKIGDISTIDMSLDKAVQLIRGEEGTEVILAVFREDWEASQEFKIKRAVIEIPSLKWELKEDNIAYIKLYQFSDKANSDFRNAALEILDSPAQKIILDLRNNPGGRLNETEKIAGWFLKRGEVIVIEDFGDEREREEHKARGNAKFLPYPTVVLINQGSASGSEILAAALRDNRGIKLIGETSFGKGSVQQPEFLKGGSMLKITVASWLTPKGELITDNGLEPDEPIEMTLEDYKEGIDLQMDRAIEIVKKIR